MTQRDLFELAVRLTGLWLILFSLRHLAGAIYYGLAMSPVSEPIGSFLLNALPGAALGLYFVTGAPAFVHFCFRGAVYSRPPRNDERSEP